ncbi:MAG: hypothetical protein IJT49_02030 [Clostridia bacterium]|nr:hypothetical protein [Clostridia bacterium]
MRKFINIIAFILAAFLLIQLIACTPSDPEPATDYTANDTQQSDTTDAKTEEEPDHALITEADGKANVKLPSGVSYTAAGYESAGGGIFRIKTGFEAVLDESIKGDFNRLLFHYTASEDFKLYVTYIQDSKEKTDMYCVEAAPDGVFSCLISSYLNGGYAAELKSFKVDICTGEEADFLIDDIKVEDYQLINQSTYYLENDRFKVGIKLGWGGGINYIEDKTCKVKNLSNLINSHDTGRLVQQSYYGTAGNDEYQPGTSFDTKWTYNPVQGGDQFGNASRLVDLKITDNSVYIKAQPQDWSLNGQLTPSYMENTYTLFDDYIKVDNRFTDFSGWEHPYHGQELPAFYTVSYLSRFMWYDGTEPWTDGTLSYKDDLKFWGTYDSECTFPLKVGNTETWCAWVSPQSDFGIGLYVPNVDVFKAGRYNYNNSKKASDDATNYVAPVNTIKLISYQPIEYSYLITTGSVDEIRTVFKTNKDFEENASLHCNYISGRVFGSTDVLLKGELNSADNIQMISSPYNTSVEFSLETGTAKITAASDNCDPHISFDYSAGDVSDAAEYGTLTIEYMIPADNAASSYACDLFLCAGDTLNPDGNKRIRQTLICDGEFHTLQIDLSKYSYWSGEIHQIRFDYFDFCYAGDVMYLKTFSLS